MRFSVRPTPTRYLAVAALAVAGVALAAAPAQAYPVAIAAHGAGVADAGRTLNVSVTYSCHAEFQWAAITVQGTQSAVSGTGSVRVPCTGGTTTATVAVGAAPAGRVWTTSPVDLALYIADAELNRTRAWATVVPG
ncbi:hypothetical protein ACFXAF_05710 [Kitasatospora sp. NPDC059463]|uniref:hypothetical protein n=1 Tax=unclassified Kitasatospora TaxID=2633591 RepID=UPI0036C7C4E6